MNPATNDLLGQHLDTLAARLGLTPPQVFHLYVAQVQADARRDSLIAILCFALGCSAMAIAYRLFRRAEATGEGVEGDYAGAGSFLVFLGIVAFLVSAWVLFRATGEWENPGYWAFRHLARDLEWGM